MFRLNRTSTGPEASVPIMRSHSVPTKSAGFLSGAEKKWRMKYLSALKIPAGENDDNQKHFERDGSPNRHGMKSERSKTTYASGPIQIPQNQNQNQASSIAMMSSVPIHMPVHMQRRTDFYRAKNGIDENDSESESYHLPDRFGYHNNDEVRFLV